MNSVVRGAVQKTAAFSEKRPAVHSTAKKNLTAVEAPSPKITALEPFCISVIAVPRQTGLKNQ